MKRYILITLTVFAGWLINMPATAQKFAVAYIDMQYILKNLPQYETANEQLSMISKRWQKEIETVNQEVQVLVSNYQTEQIFLSAEMKKLTIFILFMWISGTGKRLLPKKSAPSIR